MNRYRIVKIKNFNKIRRIFPETVLAVVADNRKWFPLIVKICMTIILINSKIWACTRQYINIFNK